MVSASGFKNLKFKNLILVLIGYYWETVNALIFAGHGFLENVFLDSLFLRFYYEADILRVKQPLMFSMLVMPTHIAPHGYLM